MCFFIVVGQELPPTVPVIDDNFRHHVDNDGNCIPEEHKVSKTPWE